MQPSFRNHKLCCLLSLLSVFHFLHYVWNNILQCLQCTCNKSYCICIPLKWCTFYYRCYDGLHVVTVQDLFSYYNSANYFAQLFLAVIYIIKRVENRTRVIQNKLRKPIFVLVYMPHPSPLIPAHHKAWGREDRDTSAQLTLYLLWPYLR